MKTAKLKIILIIIVVILLLPFVYGLILAGIDLLPSEQTEFDNIDAFWALYPSKSLEFSEEITNNATELKYYTYNHKFFFKHTEAYGISMVLDAKDYEKLKNSFTGEFELVFSNGMEARNRKLQRFNHIESFMISEQGNIGISELIPDDINDYEIFYFCIYRNHDNYEGVKLLGEGVLGNKETGRVISFYNAETVISHDYYLDVLHLENEYN